MSEPATERPSEYISDMSFDDIGMSEALRRAVAERGYEHPTPVQSKAFAPVVQGRDLIVRSKTGTGKTAAFALPLLHKLADHERKSRVLVLCPTRELALQVADEFEQLAKYKQLSIAPIYGGASMKTQEDALEKGAAVIVGTPGRIYDHIRRKNLKLDACDHVVLDEADEMLNQGFYEEVTRILDTLPKTRQVLLFSATVPPDIQNLITRYTTNAETLLLSGDVLTVDHIHHIRYEVSDAFPKPRNLVYVLEMEQPTNAIVFCNTRDDTSLVTAVLNRNGFEAELLNGDLPQKERERVMAKVKKGEVAFMVATDIAARGIDISDLPCVVNYSLPEDPAVYLHRVGRTGRIGKKGVAINLVTGREISTLSVLEKKYNIAFDKKVMPLPEDASRLWTERHLHEIRDGAAGSVYEGFLPLASAIKGRPDAEDLVAFLLKYFFHHSRVSKAAAALEEPKRAPRPARPERERERERPERRERPPRSDRSAPSPGSPSASASPKSTRLWLNLGAQDGLDAAGLGTLLESLGAPAGKIMRVDIRPGYSYVFIAPEETASFEALTGKTHGDKALKLEPSRPPPRRR